MFYYLIIYKISLKILSYACFSAVDVWSKYGLLQYKQLISVMHTLVVTHVWVILNKLRCRSMVHNSHTLACCVWWHMNGAEGHLHTLIFSSCLEELRLQTGKQCNSHWRPQHCLVHPQWGVCGVCGHAFISWWGPSICDKKLLLWGKKPPKQCYYKNQKKKKP